MPPAATADLETTLGAALERAGDGAVVVAATRSAFDATVRAAHADDHTAGPAFTIITPRDVCVAVRRGYRIATLAADIVEADRLTLYATTESLQSTHVIGPDELTGILRVGGHAVPTRVEDDQVVADARERATSVRGDDPFALHMPGRTRVRTTLAEEFSPALRDDVETAVRTDAALDGDRHVAELLLLVGAVHEVGYRELRKWAAHLRVTSEATLSRHKSELEERGIVDIEKLPTEVGAPQHGLVLAAGLPTDVDALVETVAERQDA